MSQASILLDRAVEAYTSAVITTAAPISSQKTDSCDLHAILEVMKKQLLSLKQERTVIQKRIAMIRQTIDGLVTVFGRNVMLTDSARKSCRSGLTGTCSQLLTESSRALTVAELLTVMQEKHPTLLAHNSNPKASLTTVLTRLSKYGTVQRISNEKGAIAWRSTIQLAAAEPSPFATEIEATKTAQPALGKQRMFAGSRTEVMSELTRACRIALMESQEVPSLEEIYARIVRRASFSFEGMKHPLEVIAGVLELLADDASKQDPGCSRIGADLESTTLGAFPGISR